MSNFTKQLAAIGHAAADLQMRYDRLGGIMQHYRSEYYKERRMRELLLKCANELLAAGRQQSSKPSPVGVASAPGHWVSINEKMPESDHERVVVRTKDGSIYFLSTINGKFPSNIIEWYPLPR